MTLDLNKYNNYLFALNPDTGYIHSEQTPISDDTKICGIAHLLDNYSYRLSRFIKPSLSFS